MPASFTSLPAELHLHISEYLPISSFHVLQQTSRRLYEIYNFHTNTYLNILTVRVNEFIDKRKKEVSPWPKNCDTPPFRYSPNIAAQQEESMDEQLLLKALMLDNHHRRPAYERKMKSSFFKQWSGVYARYQTRTLNDQQNLVYRFHLRLVHNAILRFSVLVQLSAEEEKQALEALNSAISHLPPRPEMHKLYVPCGAPQVRNVLSTLYDAILQTENIQCIRKLQQIPHFFPLPDTELLQRACHIGNLKLVRFLLSKDFKFVVAGVFVCASFFFLSYLSVLFCATLLDFGLNQF